MITLLLQFLGRLDRRFGGDSNLRRWRKRARRFGRRAALSLAYGDAQYDAVTAEQQAELFPRLAGLLRPGDRLVLDVGCGPGRFTAGLASLCHGRAIGIDPIPDFLRLAPTDPRVEYRAMVEGRIPLADGEADVIWICLVLGGLRGVVLGQTLKEIDRVLAPEGLLFVVENTDEVAKDVPIWTHRSIEAHRKMFPRVKLEHLHDYRDASGERISVLAGRR